MPPMNNRFQRRVMPVLPPRPLMNHQITASELRVIGENGENLGVISREKAIAAHTSAGRHRSHPHRPYGKAARGADHELR